MEVKQNYGKILIVDNQVEDIDFLSEILIAQGYLVSVVRTGKEAIASVKAELSDLILLNTELQDMSGFEVCIKLKSDKKTFAIPIIFLSASNDSKDKIKAYTVGGANFITTPFILNEVLGQVKNLLDINRLRIQAEQQKIDLQLKNKQLEIEITERKRAGEVLESQHYFLKSLINSPKDILIFSIDKNYCYTTFNENHRKEMKRVWNADIQIGNEPT